MKHGKKQNASSEKVKALAITLAQIDKQFGKGSVMRLGETEVVENIPAVSTGSLSLDVALGVGGLPRGRVVEIFGPESSGKTTLTLQVISEMQKIGGICAFVDAEHALDTQYAKKLGVDLNELLVSQPDTGEQALEIVDNVEQILAIELINASQALFYRKEKTSPFLESFLKAFRDEVPKVSEDRILHEDLQNALSFLKSLKLESELFF